MPKTIREEMDEVGFGEKLELVQPIMLNNEKLTELPLAPDKVTTKLYLEACSQNPESSHGTSMMENDAQLHFWMGCAVVKAADSRFDWADFDQLSGQDAIRLTAVGRFFTNRSVSGVLNDSDESPDDSESSSTSPSEKSEQDPSESF